LKRIVILALAQDSGECISAQKLPIWLQKDKQIEYRGLFIDNLVQKTLTYAGVSDVETPSGTNGKANITKLETILQLEDSFKNSNISFKIVEDGQETSMLKNISLFAQLLIISAPLFERLYESYRGDFEYLSSLFNCPVYVLPQGKTSKVENLLILSDGDESSLRSVKNFIDNFSTSLINKPVSTLTIIPSDEEEILREKLLVGFIKMNFRDVGLQVTLKELIHKDMQRLLDYLENPILITGKSGLESIINSGQFSFFKQKNIPIFFLN